MKGEGLERIKVWQISWARGLVLGNYEKKKFISLQSALQVSDQKKNPQSINYKESIGIKKVFPDTWKSIII